MNKTEFLSRLREGLSGIPQDEAAERLTFYSEMIEDRMEDGLSEETAVAEIGSPEKIAQQIAAEVPLSRLVREKVRTTRRLQAWEIVLLVLGFPLWFSLLIAAFAVLLSVYIVIWAVIVSLWAVEVSFIVGSVCGGAAGSLFLLRGDQTQGLLLISAGIVLAGLSIFLFFGCRAAGRGAVKLTKKIASGIRSLFLRKENA